MSLAPIIPAVIADALTYLDEAALTDLHAQVLRIEQQAIPGILVEAGCALGGSAIVLAAAKAPSRPLHVYDVFGIIPPPSERDGQDVLERYKVIIRGDSDGIAGQKYYGYEENLVEKVTGNFARHGLAVDANHVHLIKGLFQDTLKINEPVALAHIDGDWYESVTVCLQRIAPHLSPGGVLIIDDYGAWSGCRTAVDEYFRDKSAEFEFVQRTRLHIVRR
jgi:asparagine synthase (glutamine-hydrolysing)